MNSSIQASYLPSHTHKRGPLALLLDLFSNVWLGITWIVLLFIYSSIGSAYPPFRQHRLLEMTEFEWFHWWPFDLLIGLLAATLITTTIRKIPLRLVNAGVWMIHVGIVTLIVGSVYYFGTKVEGDIPVFRRNVVIKVPGAKRPLIMLARPENRATAAGLAGEYEFEITQIRPNWPILSGEDKGAEAYSVSVLVRTPQQKEFVRQLLAGYPQYTEDILPGQGRAVKVTGKKLVDESLKMSLDYASQTHFFVEGTSALYLRPQGSKQWAERRIEGLPRYHERFSSSDQIWHATAEAYAPDPIDLPILSAAENDPYSDIDFRVDGYLPYAVEQMRWADGGADLYPIVGLSVHSAEQHADFELAAFDERAGKAQNGNIEFRWLESPEDLEQLVNSIRPTLTIKVPEKDISLDIPLDDPQTIGAEAPFRKIEGSAYEYRVRNKIDNFPVGDGRILSLAIVDVRTPENTFTRMVADDPRSTRDMSAEGSDAGHEPLESDTRIVMTYQPPPPPITVVAGPEPMGLTILANPGTGRIQRHTAAVGENVTLAAGMTLRVTHFYRNGSPVSLPRIVPRQRRDGSAMRMRLNSMIRVTLSAADWTRSLWLPYNQWAFPDQQFDMPGRRMYAPRDLHLPDGRHIELMFSRGRHAFPAPVTLDDFTLLTHQGGLIGTNSNIRNYISQLRFADAAGKWSEPMSMSLNEPAQRDGWWFFQSTWDAPRRGYGGLNYTGVGVGNRNGVYIQLTGVCIAVAGMLFAFYVKPTIIRRRLLETYAQVKQGQEAADQAAPQTGSENAPEPQPVGAGKLSRK
ncbi:MAG: hypothetical protein IID34_08010 [Planctomycetes bacterium]|nr:hypothetical protein [Planctomycetota bacterium]